MQTESGTRPDSSVWHLDPRAFIQLQKQWLSFFFGSICVVLKYPTQQFVSWVLDVVKVNASSIRWENVQDFGPAPFPLIGRALTIFRLKQVRNVLVGLDFD